MKNLVPSDYQLGPSYIKEYSLVGKDKKEEKGKSKSENSPLNVEAAHSPLNMKSSKIGENLNVKSSLSDTEINQSQNFNILLKQSENKNKLNKQKRKEKKKEAKTGQFLKKLNVSSIEVTCSKVCFRIIFLHSTTQPILEH